MSNYQRYQYGDRLSIYRRQLLDMQLYRTVHKHISMSILCYVCLFNVLFLLVRGELSSIGVAMLQWYSRTSYSFSLHFQ